jgi:hypothetical protein
MLSDTAVLVGSQIEEVIGGRITVWTTPPGGLGLVCIIAFECDSAPRSLLAILYHDMRCYEKSLGEPLNTDCEVRHWFKAQPL